MTKPITLGIAGGTGAGKTTLASAVYKALGGGEWNPSREFCDNEVFFGFASNEIRLFVNFI